MLTPATINLEGVLVSRGGLGMTKGCRLGRPETRLEQGVGVRRGGVLLTKGCPLGRPKMPSNDGVGVRRTGVLLTKECRDSGVDATQRLGTLEGTQGLFVNPKADRHSNAIIPRQAPDFERLFRESDMATFEQEETIKNELKALLDELGAIKPDDLIRADVLGKELSFEPGRAVFERTLKLFRDLSNSNLDNVSFNILQGLKNQTQDAVTKFKQIREFSLSKYPNNAVAQRDGFINAIQEAYNGYFSTLHPVIAYSIRKGTDFEQLESRASDLVKKIEEQKTESETKQKHILVEMDSTLQKVRQAAAEVGVSQHATHFKVQSDDHAGKSKNWLIATVITAILTAAWGGVTFFIHPEGTGGNPPTTAQIVQFTFSKIIILSGLYYALVWCGRNYSAHRHNHVVNKHRQNALSSFETFAKAAGDDVDIKNAVLLQATQSIFSPQMSGYTEKDADGVAPNKIIEILRSVSSSAAQKP